MLKGTQTFNPVLIMAHEPDVRKLLLDLVAGKGFEVLTAADGASGISIIEQSMPGLVIMDMNLPDMRGSEVLKRTKTAPGVHNPFVMILSDIMDSQDLAECRSLGACDFIKKPFNEAELRIKIGNMMEHLRYRELLRRYEELRNEKEKIESERNLLAKYFPKDLIGEILSGNISTEIGGEIKTATVLFCDLRDSTQISESIEPHLFAKFLNNLFTDITDIIYGESGSVNKFLGDGILATFGIPKPVEDDAYHGALVGIKIRKYLANFNQFRPKYLADPVSLGIGITRGRVFTGNVGSANQIDFTVLGDPVNLASRLESLTKRANLDIFIDGNLREALGDRARVKLAKLSSIRGKKQEVKLYYLESLN
jgi:class 3 adenylate cyclase